MALRGRAPTPSVLLLTHKHGEISVRLEPVNAELIWTRYASPEGEALTGFYALQQALYDRYAGEYEPGKVRILTVGPAALYTDEGAIGSNPVRRKGQEVSFSPVVDWAGRGGLGSRLLQFHISAEGNKLPVADAQPHKTPFPGAQQFHRRRGAAQLAAGIDRQTLCPDALLRGQGAGGFCIHAQVYHQFHSAHAPPR